MQFPARSGRESYPSIPSATKVNPMAYDPRFQNQLELQAIADSARERSRKHGLAGLPLLVLVVVLPFLLIARGSMWAWRKTLRRS